MCTGASAFEGALRTFAAGRIVVLTATPSYKCPAAPYEAAMLNVDAAAHRLTFSNGATADFDLLLYVPPHRAPAVVREAGLLAASGWAGRDARRAFDGVGECFVETGDGKAGFGAGNFYAEPTPQVTFHAPSRRWHWGKLLFERRWLKRWV